MVSLLKTSYTQNYAYSLVFIEMVSAEEDDTNKSQLAAYAGSPSSLREIHSEIGRTWKAGINHCIFKHANEAVPLAAFRNMLPTLDSTVSGAWMCFV